MMNDRSVLIQMGEDAEFGICVPAWVAETLGDIAAYGTVVRVKDVKVTEIPIVLKSFPYYVEAEDE